MHPAGGRRRVRLRDGGRAGGLPPALRREAAAGLPGRGEQAADRRGGRSRSRPSRASRERFDYEYIRNGVMYGVPIATEKKTTIFAGTWQVEPRDADRSPGGRATARERDMADREDGTMGSRNKRTAGRFQVETLETRWTPGGAAGGIGGEFVMATWPPRARSARKPPGPRGPPRRRRRDNGESVPTPLGGRRRDGRGNPR